MYDVVRMCMFIYLICLHVCTNEKIFSKNTIIYNEDTTYRVYSKTFMNEVAFTQK